MTGSPEDSDPTLKPRGLWSVIAHSSEPMSSDEVTDEESTRSEAERDERASVTPRSLFTILHRAETAALPENNAVVELESASTEAPSSDSSNPTEALRSSTEVDSIGQVFQSIVPVAQLSAFAPKSSLRRVRQGSIALVCGLASIALSALSMRPEVWMSIPASAAGFFAIILGYLALTGGRLRNLSAFAKAASQTAMLLGTLGIFLGPLVFSRLGKVLRESNGQSQTQIHQTPGKDVDRR